MACSYCGTEKVVARGLCSNCYQRLRNRGTLERLYNVRIGICTFPGCTEKVDAKGLCSSHYQRSQHPIKGTWKNLRSRSPGEFPETWARFEAFLGDVGERPSPKHQLRRTDPRLPWSKDNSHWSEPVGQKPSSMSSKEKSEYAREWKLRRHYKISGAKYDAMFEAQGGVCAICKRPPKDDRLAIDHDHVTGNVRGLLCVSCNRGIGYLGDSIKNVEAAVAYLRSYA